MPHEGSGANDDRRCSISVVTSMTDATRFSLGRLLGKGAYSRVYEAFDAKRGERLAIKIISKKDLAKDDALKKLRSEIETHQNSVHESIVRFHSTFEDAKNHYVLTELCANQTLYEVLRRRSRLTEAESIYYMHQLVDGVRYLHDGLILHRDLKLANVFIDHNMRLKLGDFGFAVQLARKDERRFSICGTPNYISPEVLDDWSRPYGERTGHSFPVDVWSLGVILYALVVGTPPFETDSVETTYRRIRVVQFSYPAAYPSQDACNLIDAVLKRVPEQRPSLASIKEHLFMSSGKGLQTLPKTALFSRPKLQRSSVDLHGTDADEKENRLQRQNSCPDAVIGASPQRKPLGALTPAPAGAASNCRNPTFETPSPHALALFDSMGNARCSFSSEADAMSARKTPCMSENTVSNKHFPPSHGSGVLHLSGWLVKEGHIIKNWRLRWFVLRGSVVSYYRSIDDANPIKSFNLGGATVQRLGDLCVNENSTSGRSYKSSKGDNVFKVSLTQRQMGNKSYVLRASSTFELEAWLEAMQAAAAEELPKPVAIRTARCL